MKPLSPRARELLSAYRREHALDARARERLLDQIAREAASEGGALSGVRATSRAARRFPRLLAAGVVSGLLALGVMTFMSRSESPNEGAASGAGELPAARPADFPMQGNDAEPVAAPRTQPGALPSPSNALARGEQAERGARELRVTQGEAQAVAEADATAPPTYAARTATPAASGDPRANGSASLVPAPELAVPAETSTTAVERGDRPGASVRGAAFEGARASGAGVREPRERSSANSRRPETSVSARRSPPESRVFADEGARPPQLLDEEIVYLRKAYDLLQGGDALRALTAVGEHARLFPKGSLADLREVTRVMALCELGRTAEAQRAARSFEERYPDSSHAARLRASCAE